MDRYRYTYNTGMVKDDTLPCEWVKYADAQRALDAEQEKVAKLEAALDAAQGESTRWFRVARLQREAGRDLRALVRAYREAKVAFDDGRLREDHHAWKERFSKLELTEAALIDYTMRTMDATTPATKGCDGE